MSVFNAKREGMPITRGDVLSALDATTASTATAQVLFNLVIDYLTSLGETDVVNGLIAAMNRSAAHDTTTIRSSTITYLGGTRGTVSYKQDKTKGR